MKKELDDRSNQLDYAKQQLIKPSVSPFFELIPTVRSGPGSAPINRTSAQESKAVLYRFHKDISFCFPDSIPFSIIPCVLELPESLSDWPNPEQLFRVLTCLLADCGFLFAEVRSAANKQYSAQDFAAMLAPQNQALETVRWTESSFISAAQKRLWKQYALPEAPANQMPLVLKRAEGIAAPNEPDWLRHCVLELFHITKDSTKEYYDVRTRVTNLVSFCQKKWALSETQLTTPILADSQCIQPPVTLLEILNSLSEICSELLERREFEVEILRHSEDMSKEAHRRCKNLCQTQKRLLSPSLLLCCSDTLFRHFRANLLERYRRPEKIPMGGGIKNDTDTLPQYFLLRQSQEYLAAFHINSHIPAMLETLYCKYWSHRRGNQLIQTGFLKLSIENILALSLMEMFCVREEVTYDDSEIPLTLAPVITYVIFHQYDFCATRPLTQVTMRTLLSPIRQPTADRRKGEIELFSRLCEIYAELYGPLYDNSVQAEWDGAFFTYSGYQFPLQKLQQKLGWSGINKTDFPIPLYYKQIYACLNDNQPSLAHDFITRKNQFLDQFHPSQPGESGWKAYQYFYKLLLKNEANCGSCSLLARFQGLLKHPYSQGAIRDFLNEALQQLLGSKSSNEQYKNCQAFCNKYELNDIFSDMSTKEKSASRSCLFQKTDPEVQCCAALEYTMRSILFERCAQRLSQWLLAYISSQANEIAL